MLELHHLAVVVIRIFSVWRPMASHILVSGWEIELLIFYIPDTYFKLLVHLCSLGFFLAGRACREPTTLHLQLILRFSTQKLSVKH